MNAFFYVSIRTTETYKFDKIRTAGVTGNGTNYKNSQGYNPICSTRDEISQPSRPISPRAATDHVHMPYRRDYDKQKVVVVV